MPSRLEYGAFLAFIKRPRSPAERRLKNFVYLNLKQDRPAEGMGLPSRYVAERMAAELEEDSDLQRLFHQAVLVPAPKSSPLRRNALWPARRIARALVDVGLGAHVAELLERREAVRRSHMVPGVERPWPDEHRDSLEVDRALLPEGARILLVDDVVTRGSTLLGCALKLREEYEDASIAGFAVARTLTDDAEGGVGVQPVVGVIEWRPGWIRRRP